MADPVEIAKLRERALIRLRGNMVDIGQMVGAEPVEMLMQSRDKAYLHAVQLNAMADWSDRVRVALLAQAAAREVKQPDSLPAAEAMAAEGSSNGTDSPRTKTKR